MEIPTKEKPWVVEMLEYERGWGSKVDDRKVFATEEEGLEFVKEFNSDNTEEEVPDWYMVASAPYKSKYF